MKFANRDLRRRALLVFLGAWLPWISLPTLSYSATPAGTNAPATKASRFLLVIETSRTMTAGKSVALQTVHELLASSLRGQARAGDSLGVWTFDDELQTGRFPLQSWTTSNAADIAAKTVDFLRGQTSDKTAEIRVALQPLQQLAARSERLTVILITSGEPVSGLRFDEQINALTSRWYEHQRQKNLPFVTVLHVANGEMASYGVTPLPWPLNWPEPPPRPTVAQTEVAANSPASKPQAKRTSPLHETKKVVQPLIVSGPSHEPAPAAAPKPEPAPETNATVNVAVSAPVSPAPANQAPAKETSSPAAVVRPVQAPPVVAPAPVAAEPSPTNHVQSEVVKAAAKVEAPSAASATPAPATAVAVSPAPKPVTPPVTAENAPPPPTPAVPVEVSATPKAPEPKPTQETAAVTEENAVSPEPQSSASAPSDSSSRSFRIGATALACASFGCLLFFLRRSRGPVKGSIVTQSLERESGCIRPPAAKPKAPVQ